jgi:hypothetical protein
MVELIPSPDKVMQILQRTGAFREGHFVYPNESIRRIIFKCRWRFVITIRHACSPSR